MGHTIDSLSSAQPSKRIGATGQNTKNGKLGFASSTCIPKNSRTHVCGGRKALLVVQLVWRAPRVALPKDMSFSARDGFPVQIDIERACCARGRLAVVCSSLFLTHISSHQRGQEWREDLSLVSGLGIPNAQYHRQAFVAQGNEKTWAFAVYWSYHSFYFGIGL